jgi:hypothetical protein
MPGHHDTTREPDLAERSFVDGVRRRPGQAKRLTNAGEKTRLAYT